MKLFAKILVCVLLCAGLGFASGVSNVNEINGWYQGVKKPSWNPPDEIFSPVWTSLYILMGIAAGLVWHTRDETKTKALMLFVLQFMFNLGWPLLFFDEHQTGLAFIQILLMLVLVISTTISFYKIKPLAGYLMIPYILWVGFAACLNGAIWWLNR